MTEYAQDAERACGDEALRAAVAGVYDEASRMRDDLVGWRHALHRMPEVGLDLPQSAAFIKERLDEAGIAYTELDDCSGIVAVLGHGEPCIMLRADFDALPMAEESGEPFASTNGCMHACGHDMHATMLLGAARMLKAREDELPGRVKLLFQPGEEGAHGAETCVRAGVLADPVPQVAFAAHVASQVPCGVMAWGENALARAHYFQIDVQGLGGHGSMPEMCVDPITPAAYIHLGLQELLAREVKAADEVALTTGAFQAGTAPNVIPDTATLKCSLRTFDDDVHDHVLARAGEIARAVAQAYRATASVTTIDDAPQLTCDAAFSRLASRAVAVAIPGVRVLDGKLHLMGSEDFSYIAREVPSAYFMVGAKVTDTDEIYGQHHPKARFNDDALTTGAAAYAAVALAWLASRSARD